jgi:hypothetical protein
MAIAANKCYIKENRAGLYDMEASVMDNKFTAYEGRSMIEENRALLLKNYTAAFHGNRQLANMNTDAVFHNRESILHGLKVEGQVQENFRDSMLNEAKIDFLDHRAKLTASVITNSEKLAKVNHLLIEINEDIMSHNHKIAEFNHAAIATNTSLLEGTLHPGKATPESNAKRIEINTSRMQRITERAKGNKRKLQEVLQGVKANRTEILENAEKIYKTRAEIEDNRKHMDENAHKIAAALAK